MTAMNATVKSTLPPTPSRPSAPAALPPDESGDLFDYQAIKDWVSFIASSVRRHRAVGLTCFGLVVAVTITAAVFMPRKYFSSSKILTRTTNIISNLSNPYRNIADEGPTRAAYETVISRENLQKIVATTGLVQHWKDHRNALMRMKDQMLQMFSGTWSDEDWLDAMVGTLEKRLSVATGDGTVEISVIWPDAQMARRLVETAQQNFLETRHVSEVAAISETIGILELHASQTQTAIDEAMGNLARVMDDRGRPMRGPISPTATPKLPKSATGTPDSPAQELAQIKFLLRTKQRAIADLEEFRQRQMSDLRAQLDQQRVVYNRSHPVIQELEQRLEALGRDSPQLITLKRDEEELGRELEAKGGTRDSADAATIPVRQQRSSVIESALTPLAPGMDSDPNVIVAQDQLRVALARQQNLILRVEAARLELDSARAAFKYRFSVVSPALTPRKPMSPNVPLILIAGLIAAFFMAFFAAAAVDLFRRSIVQSWQIERGLKLPVLANIKL